MIDTHYITSCHRDHRNHRNHPHPHSTTWSLCPRGQTGEIPLCSFWLFCYWLLLRVSFFWRVFSNPCWSHSKLIRLEIIVCFSGSPPKRPSASSGAAGGPSTSGPSTNGPRIEKYTAKSDSRNHAERRPWSYLCQSQGRCCDHLLSGSAVLQHGRHQMRFKGNHEFMDACAHKNSFIREVHR